MPVYKNTTDDAIDIPLLGLHVEGGATFEVPDEVAHSFDVNPWFAASRTKSPDLSTDPTVVEAVTGSVPVVAPAEPVN